MTLLLQICMLLSTSSIITLAGPQVMQNITTTQQSSTLQASEKIQIIPLQVIYDKHGICGITLSPCNNNKITITTLQGNNTSAIEALNDYKDFVKKCENIKHTAKEYNTQCTIIIPEHNHPIEIEVPDTADLKTILVEETGDEEIFIPVVQKNKMHDSMPQSSNILPVQTMPIMQMPTPAIIPSQIAPQLISTPSGQLQQKQPFIQQQQDTHNTVFKPSSIQTTQQTQQVMQTLPTSFIQKPIIAEQKNK